MAKHTALVFVEDAPDRTILWPCIIPVPMNGGQVSEQEVTARFSVLPGDEHAKIVRQAAMDGTDMNVAVLTKVLRGFDALKNDAGETVPDDVAIATMMKRPYAVLGLIRGYMAMREGRVAKNAETSSEPS